MESEQGLAIPTPSIQVDADMVLTSEQAQGESLGYIQDLAEKYKDGRLDYRDFAWCAFGQTYEDTEQKDLQIFIENYVCGPEGKAEIMRMAQEMMGDDIRQEMDQLVERGLMTKEGVPNGDRTDLRESGLAGCGSDSPGDPLAAD